jgi:2-polyprenyl-3-methyl-5-hydroxy-6-metoxy-1,4-benzoquinol methylase
MKNFLLTSSARTQLGINAHEVCSSEQFIRVMSNVLPNETLNNSSLQDLTETAIFEALHFIDLLGENNMEPSLRVLEVGAGFGIASIILAMLGFDVVASEPGGIGFERNKTFLNNIAQEFDIDLTTIDATAEEIDFHVLGKFDLIFSNNVLEHVQDPIGALDNLLTGLNPSGSMIHLCPNYSFPFEPHFGIPLIPFFPHLTRKFLPNSVTTSGLWKSLNWVKYPMIKRWIKKCGLNAHFRKNLMITESSRFIHDDRFTQRHPSLAKLMTSRFSLFLNLLLRLVPLRMASPMMFTITIND